MNTKEEYIKCIKDPFYFIKNYCVVKDKKTGKTVNINFSRNNMKDLLNMF